MRHPATLITTPIPANYYYYYYYYYEKLKWDIHINMVKKRISNSFFAINKAKHVMDRHQLKTLYYSLVYHYLLYGITLWGANYHTYLSKLVIMQKKIIRIISGAKYDAHT